MRDITIRLSEEQYASLPENQRFWVDQLLLVAPAAPPKETPKFEPVIARSAADRQADFLATRNSFGGTVIPHKIKDPNQR